MVIIKQHIKKSKYEKFDIYRQVDFKDISYLSAAKLLNIKTLPINTILIVIYTLIDKAIIKVVYKDGKPYIYQSKDFSKYEVNKLKGLYNFLTDYTNLSNLKIKYVEIYEKYYLYALSFNLTAKELKINSKENLFSYLSVSVLIHILMLFILFLSYNIDYSFDLIFVFAFLMLPSIGFLIKCYVSLVKGNKEILYKREMEDQSKW